MRPINTFDLQTLRQHMHQTLIQGSNRQRFELSQERNRLQKELLQLWFVSSFFIWVFISSYQKFY